MPLHPNDRRRLVRSVRKSERAARPLRSSTRGQIVREPAILLLQMCSALKSQTEDEAVANLVSWSGQPLEENDNDDPGDLGPQQRLVRAQ